MNIHEIKRSLFKDLINPMSYLDDKGFIENTQPDSAKLFGSSLYFYCGDKEWKVITPECRVLSSTVNSFIYPTHVLTLDVPNDWKIQMLEQLKCASRIAWEQKLLPMTSENVDTFENFWNLCGKPDMLTLEQHAYSRRGRKKQFVNLFHRSKEITGRVLLQPNAVVRVSIKWTLSESEESGSFGWRAHFSSGIDIYKFGGQPFVFRKPWTWENLRGKQLIVPLYDSFIVKTPALHVKNVQGSMIWVDIQKDKTNDFVRAIQSLHKMSKKIEWDACLCIIGTKKVKVGDVIVASIFPKIQGDSILWYTRKLLISNNVTRSAKRHCSKGASVCE